MIRQLTFLLLFTLILSTAIAQEATQWRGANSEAKYEVNNLLQKWPETGPEILWTFEKLGEGHSSPAFANGKIYCTGMLDGQGILFIFNENGTLEKKYNYAKEWDKSYDGTRSTPTIVDNRAYLYTGHGEIICLNLTDGKRIWTKNISDYNGRNIHWGVTESLLVDGEKLFVSVGGEENNIVALDRITGNTIWSSAAKKEKSSYCTPKIINFPSRKLFVTHTAHHIIGLDASNGKMLWSYPHTNQYSIHPNTVIYDNNALLCFSGYGQGCVRLNLTEDGSAIEKAWSTEKMDNQMGGAIIHDGYVYSSGHRKRGWYCLDWETGEEKFKSTELGNGVIIMAGDKFIIYSDRGELALVNPNPEKLDIISKTKVQHGSAQHWAHPVVHNNVLYVRHGNALIAYKISK